MHNYVFAFSSKELAPEKYLVSIDSPVRLDEIPADGHIKIDILHGATPAAPTIMTSSVAKAVGSADSIEIETPLGTITLGRYQLLDNPIVWTTEIDGVNCEVPIYYEECIED